MSVAVNLSTNRCLQAVVNHCEFVGHDREQSASFICNDYDLKMAMFVITRNYICKLLHVTEVLAKFTRESLGKESSP
jgi:hypothetical protein